ncbi:Rv3235 family protein [Streptomyces sp. NPDC057199]|uniref:Rv3235 family protein n=1 Tax=Streptomyces sp. NPDC057199 TaxID=3346047 RepID=UPI00363EB487
MTESAERGLRAERVAEVAVTLSGGGAGRRGSGYLVSPGRVLTAAHVVVGAERVRVRFQADRPDERTVEAVVEWRHDGIDIAVLGTGDTAPLPHVLFGCAGETDAVLRCSAMGFPRFKLRTDEDGSRFRDAEHVHATCAVLSNRREGSLDLCVASPPAEDPDSERDAWEGMSGAAVFSNDRLVGVVTRHHRSDGPGRIAAGRVDRWAEFLDVTELVGLEHLLECGLAPAALSDVVPDPRLGPIQEAHQAQLIDIALEELTGRATAALAAWFALHLPHSEPARSFTTVRYASQFDGDAQTGDVIAPLTVGAAPTARPSHPTVVHAQMSRKPLPQPRPTDVFADRLLAVLSGQRPVHCMLRHTAARAYDELAWLAERGALRTTRGTLPVVRDIGYYVPRPGAVEAFARIGAGDRLRAMAFRLERGHDLRWRCTAVELGG